MSVDCEQADRTMPMSDSLAGQTVIVLFDAATTKDGLPYTHTWYFQMKESKVIKAIAFSDTRDFDEFWARVSPVS